MTITVADVQGLWQDLKGVTSDALALLAAKPVDTKRIPLFQSLPVVFPILGAVGALPEKREVTWVNPAGDAYFTEVGHETVLELTAGGLNRFIVLADTEFGLVPTGNGGSEGEGVKFDFEWNFKYGRDGAQYGIESSLGGTDGYLSRKDFGNKIRGNMLGWTPDDPFILKAGDSITWTILPTFFDYITSVASVRVVTVNLFMNGFRTGTPAEADYELK